MEPKVQEQLLEKELAKHGVTRESFEDAYKALLAEVKAKSQKKAAGE